MIKFEYSIRKHSAGFTISSGNVDKDGNFVDDGSYRDLMTFGAKDQSLAENMLCGLTVGSIKLKQ